MPEPLLEISGAQGQVCEIGRTGWKVCRLRTGGSRFQCN